MTDLKYPALIRHLSKEEGSGYLIEFPDLPGCYGDGETPEEAVKEGIKAIDSWIKTAKEFGDPVPSPKEKYSGQYRLRIPRSLHASLAYRAKYEGVSLNSFVTALLAEGIGRLEQKSTH